MDCRPAVTARRCLPARLMVEAGARVIIGDILDERGRETAREIGGGDPAAVFQHLDVTSEDDWNGAIGHCGPASCSPRSCELRLPPS